MLFRSRAKTATSREAESTEKSENTIPEPTFTDGKVSAAERSVEGGKVIHANVDINPGNSGGPLFNTKGNVVGIASFISVDEDGKKVGNASYFVPISAAKQQLQGLGLTAELGDLTKQYREAIDRSAQKDFEKALSLFKAVRDSNPEFPYIQQQITQTQTAADQAPKGLPLWLMGLVGVVSLGGGMGVWWMRRKVQKQEQIVAAKNAIESALPSEK